MWAMMPMFRILQIQHTGWYGAKSKEHFKPLNEDTYLDTSGLATARSDLTSSMNTKYSDEDLTESVMLCMCFY